MSHCYFEFKEYGINLQVQIKYDIMKSMILLFCILPTFAKAGRRWNTSSYDLVLVEVTDVGTTCDFRVLPFHQFHKAITNFTICV